MMLRNPIEHRAIEHDAIVLAAFAGATAEVLWVALYCALTPLQGIAVLREITISLLPGMAASALAPALGLAIHFALAVAVAYAFVLLVWLPFARARGAIATLLGALLALAAVWCMNFFVLLPALNAGFVALMPYAVTFASKLWFGLAMGATLHVLTTSSSRHEARTLIHT